MLILDTCSGVAVVVGGTFFLLFLQFAAVGGNGYSWSMVDARACLCCVGIGTRHAFVVGMWDEGVHRI